MNIDDLRVMVTEKRNEAIQKRDTVLADLKTKEEQGKIFLLATQKVIETYDYILSIIAGKEEGEA